MPHRVGVYFAVVQLFFTLTWTIYVIFLPKLAAQAGIPKHWIVYILLADQLVFVVMDLAMGVMADRVARVLGRLGYIVLAVTLGSCLAFLLMPFAAPQGAAWLFLALTLLWAVSSSALRAPPFTLLGKYAPAPSVPWLSALSLFGLGVAGAISPYLTIVLRDLDPRIPFALSSIALALTTAGIIWGERTLAKNAPAGAAAQTAPKPNAPVIGFFVAVLLLGLGFQIHFSLNSAGQYLKLAKPDQIPYLMPVFWIGFNLLMLPASLITKRYGGIAVAAAGALLAAVGALGALYATNLDALVALQFIAGGGWGLVLMSAFAAAIAMGHTGREGKLTGGLFALLALAAFARIAMLAAEINKDPELAAAFAWAPVVMWTAGGVLLVYLYLARPEARTVPA